MKKILLGALVCAAVAGIVAYAINPEKVNESLGDLRKKAEDLLGQVREGAESMREESGNAMG